MKLKQPYFPAQGIDGWTLAIYNNPEQGASEDIFSQDTSILLCEPAAYEHEDKRCRICHPEQVFLSVIKEDSPVAGYSPEELLCYVQIMVANHWGDRDKATISPRRVLDASQDIIKELEMAENVHPRYCTISYRSEGLNGGVRGFVDNIERLVVNGPELHE